MHVYHHCAMCRITLIVWLVALSLFFPSFLFLILFYLIFLVFLASLSFRLMRVVFFSFRAESISRTLQSKKVSSGHYYIKLIDDFTHDIHFCETVHTSYKCIVTVQKHAPLQIETVCQNGIPDHFNLLLFG